ncbi:hypothetical protein [Paenibacillus daejeonensis]|uniref:hypothetical protein n=1 Tax=Paenibacillus daejeonensis TaxID=135193 RepID=UPI000363A938|nr:hypothetical protein [Paenibacillus daejeonensis]
MIEKWAGETAEIIYLDRHGQLSQRVVEIRSVRDGRARVYCHKAGAQRVLIVANVLSARRKGKTHGKEA